MVVETGAGPAGPGFCFRLKSSRSIFGDFRTKIWASLTGESPLLAPKTREKWGTRGCHFWKMEAGRGMRCMKNRGMEIKHPKLRGEWAELQFMLRAVEKELHLNKPWGEVMPYDFIVEHEG